MKKSPSKKPHGHSEQAQAMGPGDEEIRHGSTGDGDEPKSGQEQTADGETVDGTLERLKTDPEQGLTEEEAHHRLEQYGSNSLEEKRTSFFHRLISKFWGPIPWMLEIAIVLAAVIGRWEDFTLIAAMLVINGGVSFWHENKAQNAIEALKAQLAPTARVIRDGTEKKTEASTLVPGDVVVLRIGNVVPADAQLLHGQHLSLDESALTGESLPVDKDEGAHCYSGTSVKRGEARAVVTSTGANTEFARTIGLVESAEEVSHFRQAVLRIGYFLIAATLTLNVAILGVGLWRGDPWIELILFVLILTVAAIPVALPAVLTVTMTVGANHLARLKAIVTRLASLEELAGLRVLCADKTGTLTKNQLTLRDPVVLSAKDVKDLVLAAALTADREGDDPIDQAILEGLDDRSILDGYEIMEFVPFDPNSKRAEAQVCKDGKSFRVAKGAPQVILDLTNADADARDEIAGKVDELARNGFRALGVARQENGNWTYLGLLSLLDPPREDTAEVLETARGYGIDVRMVTGDHIAIAKQIARQVGLGQNIQEAKEIFGESDDSDNERVRKKVLEADGFAEVTPEHKFAIVKHFQSGDQIVGMTGDGVNDAPALKQANVGIAVAHATDAARAAADLALTGPGLSVITRAVEEARRIFERMISYATFRIAETIRVLIFVSASIIVFNFYPVTAIMIVLLALLNDLPIMTIAIDHVPTPSRPVRWDMRRVLTLAGILGVAGVFESFLLYWFVRTQLQLPPDQIQTIIFLKLLVAGHMTLFLTRNEGWLWQRPWPSPVLFLTLEGTQILGTLVAIFGIYIQPIPWQYALAVWGYALATLLIINLIKVGGYRFINRFIPRKEESGVQ